MTGGNMISGYAQGKAQEEQMAAMAAAEDEARRRYGENIGTVIPLPVFNPETGRYEYPDVDSTTPGGG